MSVLFYVTFCVLLEKLINHQTKNKQYTLPSQFHTKKYTKQKVEHNPLSIPVSITNSWWTVRKILSTSNMLFVSRLNTTLQGRNRYEVLTIIRSFYMLKKYSYIWSVNFRCSTSVRTKSSGERPTVSNIFGLFIKTVDLGRRTNGDITVESFTQFSCNCA